MRLSTVVELLVIALLIAFMASELDARVIDEPESSKSLSKPTEHRFANRKDRQRQVPDDVLAGAAGGASGPTGPSRYCTCASLSCNCCRQFSLPVVPVKGPGCATISYLHDNAMMVTMSFGDRVLRNITVNSKKPKPICMPMPGGISKFCGRLYSIKRDGDNFKACLGLELRALQDVEAALRVSCFKFGPSGVNVEPGEAFPVDKVKEEEDEDDDDYGFGDLDEDDDDDDDDDDFGLTGDDDEDDDDDDENLPAKDNSAYNDVDSSDSDADYTGFGTLSEELFGGFFESSGKKKKKPVKSYNQVNVAVAEPGKLPEQVQTQAPVIVLTETSKPEIQRRPAKKPAKVTSTTPAPVKRTKSTTPTPVKRTKTTPSPVKTLATSTRPTTEAQVSTTPKPPKKKKKPSRRRPGTAKPSSSTEAPPTVITATTMTVNVVQGDVVLNDTMPQKVNSVQDVSLKFPMSKPVVETKPVEPFKQAEEPLKSSVSIPQIDTATEKLNTETNEATTQAILQNTIPLDDSVVGNVESESATFSVKIPIETQNDEALVEDKVTVNTTPYDDYAEDATKRGSTEQDSAMYTGNVFKSGSGQETADETTEGTNEFTTARYISEQTDAVQSEQAETVAFESMATTLSLNSATAPTEMDEGTDKTEVLSKDSNQQETQESVSDEGSENNDEDDDEDGIDIGADLGFDDDDEEDDDESNSEKKPAEKVKPEDKEEEDDDDDILGGLLDDDEDDEKEESKSTTNGQERTLGSHAPFQINPMLYRIARVSSGSMATGRHLPMFSEGRNRRNNKRMRFPSLEVTL